MPKVNKKIAPKLWMVLHDIHFPKTNWECMDAVFDFLRQNKIDGITLGGDQLDMESISHHTKGKGLFRLPGAYMQDVKGFDEKVLKPLEALLPKGIPKVYHIGNHERFEQDFIECHPELQDAVDHVEILNLVKRGWDVKPLGHCSNIGKLVVIHGEILTGIGNQAGMYPSRKAVELYENSVLAGHTHTPQSFTKVSPVDEKSKHTGWIAPCMCDVNPGYLRNRPTAWLNGFTLVEVRDTGHFNVYPIVVWKGQFCYGGKTYGK